MPQKRGKGGRTFRVIGKGAHLISLGEDRYAGSSRRRDAGKSGRGLYGVLAAPDSYVGCLGAI